MWLHGGGYKRLKDWRMYTSVVEKSPGRKIERKQYVVLIEKEVPNLVLEELLKTSGRRSSLKDKQEERIYATLLTLSQLSRGLYLHPWPIWLAGWESWDHKWSLMTDNLDPTPVGLPTTMSTSTLTVIMPPNASCQLNREGHWWPVQQVSWAGRHGFTISILWQSFKDRMMEWWA